MSWENVKMTLALREDSPDLLCPNLNCLVPKGQSRRACLVLTFKYIDGMLPSVMDGGRLGSTSA